MWEWKLCRPASEKVPFAELSAARLPTHALHLYFLIAGEPGADCASVAYRGDDSGLLGDQRLH